MGLLVAFTIESLEKEKEKEFKSLESCRWKRPWCCLATSIILKLEVCTIRQMDLQKMTKQSIFEMETRWTEKWGTYKTFLKSKSPNWMSPAKDAVTELLLGSRTWIGLIFLRNEKEDLSWHIWYVAPLSRIQREETIPDWLTTKCWMWLIEVEESLVGWRRAMMALYWSLDKWNCSWLELSSKVPCCEAVSESASAKLAEDLKFEEPPLPWFLYQVGNPCLKKHVSTVWLVFSQQVQSLLPLDPLPELPGILLWLEKLLLKEVELSLSLIVEKATVSVGDWELDSPINSLSYWSTREKVLTKEGMGSISMTWDQICAYTSLRPCKKRITQSSSRYFLSLGMSPQERILEHVHSKKHRYNSNSFHRIFRRV